MHQRASFQATDEQSDIAGRPLGPGQMLIVDAFAGSGKTTTLDMVARANPKLRFLYLCFNRDLKEAGQKRFPKNVDVKTSHGLAFGRFGSRYKAKLGELRPAEVRDELGCLDIRQAHLVLDTVRQFLYSCDTEILDGHVRAHGSEAEGIVPLANKLWHRMRDVGDSQAKMPHDGYLKLWAHSDPDLSEYDVILFDEAQDANPLLLWLLLMQWKKGKIALVMVGDRHQGIYGFRGSICAMSLASQMATQRAILSQSFRFPQNVADQASLLLREFKAEPVKIVGRGNPIRPDGPAAFLSRTNAGLIDRAVELMQSGYKINFSATKAEARWDPHVPYRFQDMLDCLAIYRGRGDRVYNPYLARFHTWCDVMEAAEGVDGVGGDQELKATVAIVMKFGPGLCGLLESLRRACVSPDEADFCLSSGHRSKGKEWPETELASDFLPVHDPAALARVRDKHGRSGFEQEVNLLYVAITRTRSKSRLPFFMQQWFDLRLGAAGGVVQSVTRERACDP